METSLHFQNNCCNKERVVSTSGECGCVHCVLGLFMKPLWNSRVEGSAGAFFLVLLHKLLRCAHTICKIDRKVLDTVKTHAMDASNVHKLFCCNTKMQREQIVFQFEHQCQAFFSTVAGSAIPIATTTSPSNTPANVCACDNVLSCKATEIKMTKAPIPANKNCRP